MSMLTPSALFSASVASRRSRKAAAAALRRKSPSPDFEPFAVRVDVGDARQKLRARGADLVGERTIDLDDQGAARVGEAHPVGEDDLQVLEMGAQRGDADLLVLQEEGGVEELGPAKRWRRGRRRSGRRFRPDGKRAARGGLSGLRRRRGRRGVGRVVEPDDDGVAAGGRGLQGGGQRRKRRRRHDAQRDDAEGDESGDRQRQARRTDKTSATRGRILEDHQSTPPVDSPRRAPPSPSSTCRDARCLRAFISAPGALCEAT